jgi:site-specific DNA recombinase
MKANLTDPQNILSKFTKGKNTNLLHENNVAVIYTRVSDVVQVSNTSLATQLEECRKKGIQKKLNVIAVFGGTFESAKTDERREFKEMIAFAKKHKATYIIVYSLERFSRSGINAISIAAKLREHGIFIISVLQDFDSKTTNGEFMQNIMFLMAHQDNQLRKEKSIAGCQSRMKEGVWCMRTPIGYKKILVDERKILVPCEKYAPLIKLAFQWKATEIISDTDIRIRLLAAGWEKKRMGVSTLNWLFKNTFYCGYISSIYHPNEVFKGVHEPIVSMDLFLAVNEKKKSTLTRSKWDNQKPEISLKGTAKCSGCSQPLTGYLDKRKNIFYYKCYTEGCQKSYAAKKLNTAFEEILSLFQIPSLSIPLLKKILLDKVSQNAKDNADQIGFLKKAKTEIETKISLIEERFVLGEITKDQFSNYGGKYIAERDALEQQINKSSKKSSDREKQINKYIELALNLPLLWRNGGFIVRNNLQNFLFPDGITFDKENSKVLTEKVNGVIALIAGIQRDSGDLQYVKELSNGFSFHYQPAIKNGLTIVTG